MRCHKCNYSLFDIRERVCPECGEAFYFSNHVFDHCGVRFCCPHCDQQYYGTDINGHLVPQSFICLRCNTRICMNEMIVRAPLHKVIHHRHNSSFPGFAGVTLSLCAAAGALVNAFILADAATFARSPRSLFQAMPVSLFSDLVDLALAPLLFIGGRGLYKRRPYGRTLLLIWCISQCANVLIYTAVTLSKRSSINANTPFEFIRIAVNDVPFIIPIGILAAILLHPRIAAKVEAWDHPPT